jgi:hypothetical protein
MALLGDKSGHKVQLTPPGETFTLELDVQCDVALADFMLGARVVELQAPRVVGLPAEWTVPGCMSNEEALQFCSSVEQNAACYELEIALPHLDRGDRGDEVAASPYRFDVATLKGGKLCFQPGIGNGDKIKETREPAPSSAGDGQEEERPATPVSTLSGEWSVRFPETATKSLLYSKVRRYVVVALTSAVDLTVF